MLIAKIKVVLLGGALAAAFSAGWYVQGLRWDADVAPRDKKQSEDISTGQQAIIAGQALQFQRYNEIAKQANQYAINIKGQSDEKQIVYRTIIKSDPAGRQCVPDDVAGRLLEYAHRLHTSARHPATSGNHATSAGTTAAGCRLTYGQVVYWIDPLLTALELANKKLKGIEEVRGR
ncbi:hypothetical protein J5069_02860 [Candidatus Symbiopectobacterium sp. NZEC127]|uniref:hypothetical protein n=1 Tax=Candidatus Symbiopectobacterium sp. NZEC127 TaxID=2820472 RepID=UPI002226B2D1|nr:hypothetical protein [Candidatus Symbiopectobacterium sp. NZEC127]MCW2484831.1 hypothetical protein [Candidatus Symbiopectobacterium sp. NZEC127]